MEEDVQGASGNGAQSSLEGRVAAVPQQVVPAPIRLDRHRSFVFPNRIRELRAQHGFPKLLAVASALPEIPYIRLSKIERGEVVARADEIVRIAGLLGVEPETLLIDVDDPGFDIDAWSKPFQDAKTADEAEEEFAILLGAATRARRADRSDLTIAAIEKGYGIPPVILSRVENAVKTLDRWNDATIASLCRFFGVTDRRELRREVERQYRGGELNEYVGLVADPEFRIQKTRKLVTQLREDLGSLGPTSTCQSPEPGRVGSLRRREGVERSGLASAPRLAQVRLVPVTGGPLPGGLISTAETGLQVEAPRAAGPRAFGLRICRPTLGAGLPGNAIVIVDPDVFPSAGGLAVIREEGAYRLLAITFDLNGAMIGHSINPALEVQLDAKDPSELFAVVAASFV